MIDQIIHWCLFLTPISFVLFLGYRLINKWYPAIPYRTISMDQVGAHPARPPFAAAMDQVDALRKKWDLPPTGTRPETGPTTVAFLILDGELTWSGTVVEKHQLPCRPVVGRIHNGQVEWIGSPTWMLVIALTDDARGNWPCAVSEETFRSVGVGSLVTCRLAVNGYNRKYESVDVRVDFEKLRS